MNLNVSFFKKSFLTGLGLAIVFGIAVVASAHVHATKDNSQITTHGTGYVAGISSDSNPVHIMCPMTSEQSRFCGCKPPVTTNSSAMPAFCLKCPHAVSPNSCQVCTQSFPSTCYWCPPKTSPPMGIACRVLPGNNNDGGNQVIPGVVSPGTTSPGSPPVRTVPSSTPPTNTGGGNIPGDPNPQPSPTPVNATCPSNPKMMIACRAPGDTNTNPGCPYLEVCTAQ